MNDEGVLPVDGAESFDLPPTRIAESSATEVAMREPAERILCTTMGRGQGAFQIASEWQHSSVTCWFLDDFQRMLADRSLGARSRCENLVTVCQPDFPDNSFDLAVLPCSQNGEAELTRDLLQAAYQRLASGGRLIAAVDNPRDHWLGEQMKGFGVKVLIDWFPDAVVYSIANTQPLRRIRSFECQFKFRDRDRLVNAVSRPGVFSHRHIDPGARRLLESAEPTDGASVLDLGCGAGTVGLAMALRGENVRVHAVDSNSRAVACTQAGAILNGVQDRFSSELNSSGVNWDSGFDLVLANPPYYSDFRIAEHFVYTAEQVLNQNGRLILVTKLPQWYEERLVRRWRNVSIESIKQYVIVRGEFVG